MKSLLFLAIALLLIQLVSCSRLYQACIRNLTDTVAIVDVRLPDITDMKKLPNKIRMTNRIFNLKSGYKKYLDSTQNVEWIGVQHFLLKIKPQTTVDLSDMAGPFINSSPRGNAIVTVTWGGITDTLLNGRYNFKHEKFQYTGSFFSSKLHYDIVPQATPAITTTSSPLTVLAAK